MLAGREVNPNRGNRMKLARQSWESKATDQSERKISKTSQAKPTKQSSQRKARNVSYLGKASKPIKASKG